MSAFLVSYNHINTLCNYIYLHNLDKDYASIEQVQALGNMLWKENARSVAYRYSELQEPVAYTFKGQDINKIKPIDFFKLVDCLIYQSCEHPEWKSSEARRVLRDLQAKAIRELPAYKSAPWDV